MTYIKSVIGNESMNKRRKKEKRNDSTFKMVSYHYVILKEAFFFKLFQLDTGES